MNDMEECKSVAANSTLIFLTKVADSRHSTSEEKDETSISIDAGAGADIDERKLLLKIDLRVLPVITIIYILAFLDRSVNA